MTELEIPFKNFVDRAQLKFFSEKRKKKQKGILRIIPNERREFIDFVKMIEEDQSFFNLVMKTRTHFINKNAVLHTSYEFQDTSQAVNCVKFGADLSECLKDNTVADYYLSLRNFFRRSGFYYSLYNCLTVDVSKLFLEFCDAFSKKEVKLTIMIPFCKIETNILDLDLGAFRIRSYTEKEFKQVLNEEIHSIFYPQHSCSSPQFNRTLSNWK